MFTIFVLATGLRNAGLVDALVLIYREAGPGDASQIAVVGATSAVGSALLNNHPMSALNALAVERLPGDATWRVLAALVGGDLGPRLLPMGSLAGLLWIDMVRRMGVTILLSTFVRVSCSPQCRPWRSPSSYSGSRRCLRRSHVRTFASVRLGGSGEEPSPGGEPEGSRARR